MEVQLTTTFIGLPNSGKTSMIHAFLNRQEQIFPTAGFEINYVTIGVKPILCYDCSGQGWSRENWKMFSSISESVAFVIDSSDSGNFANAKKVLYKFLETNKYMKNKNLCIMLNKIDKKIQYNKQVLVRALQKQILEKYVSKLYIKQTSAFSKEGLDECFDWMVKNSVNS